MSTKRKLGSDQKNARSENLDGLNPHKGAGPDGLFPKVLKVLKSQISSVFARMFNLSLQTAQVPEDRPTSSAYLRKETNDLEKRLEV